MKKRTAWVLAAAVAALALGAAAVGAVALVVRGSGRSSLTWSAGGQYLSLELEGSIPEQPASGFSSLFEERSVSLPTLVEAIDGAARDAKVKGLLLRVGQLDVGWGRAAELRDALLRFRRSGKPSWAHLELAGNQEYFLATGCQKIAASPTAMLDISGLAAEVTFFKGALDKLGVEAQFEGVGKYKNAPNQFTERGFTEPHREQMEALVSSLFESYVQAIAQGRKLSPEAVRRAVDGGPYDATRALAAGLLDELLYRDEVEGRIGVRASITPGRYVRASRGFSFDSRAELGVVYVVGTIVSGESQEGPFGTYAGADTVARGLREAAAAEAVKAIVLRVDSPGGSGTASDAIWREVGLARRRKPVVVSMGDYAASGGYYVAMNADAIVAEQGTITGSIGVFSGKFSTKGLFEKLGLSEGFVQRGRHARLYSSSQPWSEEERQQVRAMNRAFYDTFVRKAAQGRHRAEAAIEAVAQGRVWSGRDALAAGLVDRLGSFATAVEVAREKARIAPARDLRLVVFPERKGFLETVLERQDEDVLSRVVSPRTARLLRFATSLGDSGPSARLPFEIAVR